MSARQEVLNVLLAQILEERGLVSAPEQIVRSVEAGRRGNVQLPDVLVDFQGLRMAMEAEFAGPADARRKAYQSARRRLDRGIAHVGVAVIYPAGLRRVPFQRQKQALADARLSFLILSEANDGRPAQGELFPSSDVPPFDSGGVSDIAEALRRSYDQLVRDDTLEAAVARMQGAVDSFVAALRSQPAATVRMAAALGMREASGGRPLSEMSTRERRAVNRVCGLIIINAMIFQEVLAQRNARVHPLGRFEDDGEVVSNLRDHWRFILEEVNYYPIFRTAFDSLNSLAAEQDMRQAVQSMVRAALWIVGRRASLRHDLAGRIFHRILAEAKYLGAYYTSIPSATLLLKLALARDGGACDWSDLDAIRGLSVADLACGTGTLLMAAADVVLDNYLRSCGDAGARVDDLHSMLVENVIHGFDVLPSAIHLTASTLALRVPDMPINVTRLSCMPLGGVAHELGSLEFLETASTAGTLFSRPATATGGGEQRRAAVSLPSADLCVMNPPFTSSRQSNLLFGNLPATERANLQRRLQQVVRDRRIPASITAGMAAVFTALGDKCLKPGGRMALVLPRGILTGAAWDKTRQLFAAGYTLEYLIASHAPGAWNFSENTNFSEVLLVARKNAEDDGAAEEGPVVTCVNLWRQPGTAVEALSLARSLNRAAPDLDGQGALEVTAGGRKFGEAVSVPWGALQLSHAWELPCSFAQTELIRVLYHLQGGRLRMPGDSAGTELPLRRLGDLASLGPDPRDVYDGFALTDSRTAYPALWGHDAAVVTSMSQRPNQYLTPHARPLPGRPLRRHTDLWPKAARVAIVQRIWLPTKRMLAVRLTQRVLSDVWWPLTLTINTRRMEDAEKALVLWLNSTPAFMLLLGCREETRGGWMQFKKPSLRALPILDVGALGPDRLAQLAAEFDRLAASPFGLLPAVDADSTRAAVDDALARVLSLPDLSLLRTMFGREPILGGTTSRLLPDAEAVAVGVGGHEPPELMDDEGD